MTALASSCHKPGPQGPGPEDRIPPSCPVEVLETPGQKGIPPESYVVECPIFNCGNSARIYGSYVEALDTSGEDGQPNVPKPFRIVRGSLTDAGGGCRGLSGLSLEVRDGGFVGVSGGPAPRAPVVVKCSGDDLERARFQLVQSGSRPVTIEIRDIGRVETREGHAAGYAPTYELVVHKEALPGSPKVPAEPLCPHSSWMGSGTRDSTSRHGFDWEEWNEPTHHALLVQGEIYDRNATVVKAGPGWFNIGCAGSGIGKLRLLGFDPMDGKSTAEERQATLKMLTGSYCPAWRSTRDGTPLYMVRYGERGALGSPRPQHQLKHVGPIESRWGSAGALCVSHLRLWARTDTCARKKEAHWVELIQRTCGIPACEEAQPCSTGDATADGRTFWRTCTIDHVPHASP